jgi:hypothetical protein
MKNPIVLILSFITLVLLVVMVLALTDKATVFYPYRLPLALAFMASAGFLRKYRIRKSK